MTFAQNDRLRISGRTFTVITVHNADRYSVREVKAGSRVMLFYRYNGLWRLGATGRPAGIVETVAEVTE